MLESTNPFADVRQTYNDKSPPFQNRISVIHIIFVKFVQTIYFYKAESAKKIDAQVNFQYTGCHDIWGRKFKFWIKK